jgi:hypothetical protein
MIEKLFSEVEEGPRDYDVFAVQDHLLWKKKESSVS